MSLRTFHLLFMLTVLAALACMGWILGNTEAVSEDLRPVYSIGFYAAAGLLAPYLVYFFLKTRHLDRPGS